MFLNSHILFLNGYRSGPPNFSIRCYATRFNPFYIFPQWERIHLVVYNLCPFSIMCICNAYIIHTTVRSARIRAPKNGTLARHRQLTLMLMLVTFAFVLLTLPSCIYFVFFRHRMSKSPESRMTRYLVQITLGCVQFTSHAINFFLYCFSTRNFRSELSDFAREVFFCILSRKPPSRVAITTAIPLRSRYSLSQPTRRNAYRPKKVCYQQSALENKELGDAYTLKPMECPLVNDAE